MISMMKRLAFIGKIGFCLSLGSQFPVAAQPEGKGSPRGEKRERPDRPAHAPQQQDRRPPQQADRQRRNESPQRTEQQARAWQQKRGWVERGGWQGHDSWQQSRARNWANEHRTWAQRGGYGGYYIPQPRFNASFGNQHYFRLGARPVIYQRYPRFDYGGYRFLMVDPWPESWSDNWYESDDVYIDYDDGYYLHNRRHAGVRLAISIIL